jgi:trimeric autotransporter adhesin
VKKINLISIVLILICICSHTTFAQPISGTKTIPGDYTTLTAAITALNTNGVGSGGVTFNIAAGYTESIADSLKLTATGTVSNKIVFQKNPSTTGANPLITRTDAGVLVTSTQFGNGDAVITLEGSDYVTFNGINIAASDKAIEYGYYIRKASGDDACKNVTIKNCTINMTKGNPINRLGVGILISNNIITSAINSNTGVTVTSEGGRHDSIVVISDSVRNTFESIAQVGYNHTSYPYNFYDQNITIGSIGAGNILHNYGGDASRCEAVYTSYSNNVIISYNDINNTAEGGTGFNSFGNGMLLTTAKATNITVSYNTISLTSVSGTRYMYGIQNNAGDTSSTINIHHNTFKNCSHTATGTFSALYNNVSGVTFNIYSNIINNNTVLSSAATIMFYFASPRYLNFYDNTISSLTLGGGSTLNYVIYLNNSTSSNIYNNKISNISDTATGGTFMGMYVVSGANNKIFNNKIYGISSIGRLIYGITIAGGTANYLYNNVISDFKLSAKSFTDAIRGINITSTTASSTVGVYYNTIYFNDSLSSGTDYGTTCMFHTFSTTATTAALDMRNNIFINKSKPSGTGNTVVFRRNAAGTLGNINISNNNCFYAGTPDSHRLIFSDSINNLQTLALYKTFISPKDSLSISVNPPFVNVITPPYDLHLNGNSQCDNSGLPITTPISILLDCDSVVRNLTTPDLGAYERIVSGVINNVNISQSYKLEQNYPNPFNPVTNIRFSIPKNEVVTLRIYDIQGKEIETILNNVNLQSGTYNVSFDGAKLSSGVYFYKLITKEFSETKKMLLIK